MIKKLFNISLIAWLAVFLSNTHYSAYIEKKSPPIFMNAIHDMVGVGEYQSFYITPAGAAIGFGSPANIGNGGNTPEGIPVALTNIYSVSTKFAWASGALHGGTLINIWGHEFSIGDNGQGQHGLGNTNSSNTDMDSIAVDANGAAFDSLVMCNNLVVYKDGLYRNSVVSLKSNGSLWIHGMAYGGVSATGKEDTLCMRPIKMGMPTGLYAKQIVSTTYQLMRASNDSAYSCGSGTETGNLGTGATGSAAMVWSKIPKLNNLLFVSSGGEMSFGFKQGTSATTDTLWTWGNYGNWTGRTDGNVRSVEYASEIMGFLIARGLRIAELTCNHYTTYIRCTNGEQYSFGNGGKGTLGDGQHLDFEFIDPSLYPLNNPAYRDGLVQALPSPMAPGYQFAQMMYPTDVLCGTFYCKDIYGQWWACGNTKAPNIPIFPKPVYPAASILASTYIDTWSKHYLVKVNWAATTSMPSTSQSCALNSGATDCSSYTIPSSSAPVPIITLVSQNTSKVKITMSSSHDDVGIMGWEFTSTSGSIDLHSGDTCSITGHTFPFIAKVVMWDNNWKKDSTTLTISGPIPTNKIPVRNGVRKVLKSV